MFLPTYVQGAGGCALADRANFRQHVQDAVALEQDAAFGVATLVRHALYADLIPGATTNNCLLMCPPVRYARVPPYALDNSNSWLVG